MNKIMEFLEQLSSILIAITRLIFLTCVMFLSGLQVILYNQIEICNLEMKGMPLRYKIRRDGDAIAFIDKLAIENPELLDIPEGELPDDFHHSGDDEEDF